MTEDDIARLFRRVEAVAASAGLRDLETGTSYGTPALKYRRKLLLRIKDGATLALACGTVDEKERLIEMAPEIYYETDHYKGWPYVLIRTDVIGDEELGQRLTDALRWRRGS